MAGGVEVVPCSLPEARALIEAGKVKSLAVMDANPASLFPKVPTLKAEIGSAWTMAAWRGIAAPKGMPGRRAGQAARVAEEGARVGKEFKRLHDQAAASACCGRHRRSSPAFMVKSDADLGATMKAVGIAK